MRTVRTGPAIGLIAQLVLLGVLAGSRRAGSRRLARRRGVGRGDVRDPGPRPRPVRPRPARAGRPGHADPGHARRRRDRPGRGRVRPIGVGADAGRARRCRSRPRRRRRLGRPPYGNRVGTRRAVRHGGRRIPDLGAQRVRRPYGRWLGARDRRRALRVRRGRSSAAVDARRTADPLLAQGGRGDPGHRSGRRGDGRPADRRRP